MAVKFDKKSGAGSKKLPGFMKSGQDARDAMAQEEARREALQNQVRRFWIPEGTETQITFLDGHLDSDGMLDCVMWPEHNLQISGKWGNFFTCVKDEEPCPICETADFYISFGFTVIDHSQYKSRKDQIIRDTLKLFACKPDTVKLLQKLAEKRGGLAGCTFDVSRTGDKSANVGNLFDFTEKRTMKELQSAYGIDFNGEARDVVPYDLAEVIPYQSAEELRELGFGSKPVGGETNYGSAI